MFEKINKVVWGLTPPIPFVTSIEADFALMRAKYMQVQVVSLYVSKKVVFLHFSGNADQVYRCWMQQNN